MAKFSERFNPDTETLTLSEWEAVEVGDNSDYSKLSEQLGCRLFSYGWPGERKVIAKHFVGAKVLDSPIVLAEYSKPLRQVIITPKIDTADFVHMLAIAYQVHLPKLEPPPELDHNKDMRVILAWLYIKEVEKLMKKHLRRYFVIRIDQLNSRVKGKLLLNRYIREKVAHGMPQVSVCQFYELTPDTLLNRIIKAGLHIARRLINQSPYHTHFSSLTSEASRYVGLLSGVTDVRITMNDFSRIHMHSQIRHYKPSLIIAKLLVSCSRFQHEAGELQIPGFFFDMNDLFEKFIVGLLMQTEYGGKLEYQSKSPFWYRYVDEVKEKPVRLKPDIILNMDMGKIVIDAKYKELFEQGNCNEDDIQTNDRYGQDIIIRGADIYQMVAYLDNLNAKYGILVYPHDGSGFAPAITITGFGNKSIRLVGIGLSDIKKLIDDDLKDLQNKFLSV